MRSLDGEVSIVRLLKNNSYEINFTKVHRADVANLPQPSKKNGALKFQHRWLRYLNVDCVHFVQHNK